MTTYSTPNASQVVTYAPGFTNPRWLGAIGHVTSLQYSFNCPGGCDTFQCNLELEPNYRNEAMSTGRIIQVHRGGQVVWDGKLDEPQPTTSGWTISAEGSGNFASDMVAYYTSTWPASQPDQSINDAISRGLRWVNPGVGSPSGLWTGQEVDPGDQTIADLLNLCCSRGGLVWYVNSQPGAMGNVLSVFDLPTAVNYNLVCTTPVGRTLGGYINTIFIRYQVTADNETTGASATFGLVSVQNTVSIGLYGPIETYIDLSDAGTMTSGQAETVGNYVLSIYQAVTFSGPFTVQPGQLLTTGGSPVDLGSVQAGGVCQLILTDFGYGGEVAPQPVTFIIGSYAWSEDDQTGTITPYQALNQSLSGLLSLENTLLTPITTTT
jgi:hypothetical protein